MKLDIRLRRGPDKDAPLYRQIAAQIEELIRSGRVAPEARLPTVRELAAALEVTAVTVQSAYAELQERELAEAVVGRGTFVRVPAPDSLAEALEQGDGAASVMANIVRAERSLEAAYPMAQANGGTDLSPAAEFLRCFQSLEPEAASLMRYGRTQGCPVLRGELCGILAAREIDARPDELMITQGATQALDLVLSVLCQPGDAVLVEEPGYLGLVGLLEQHGITAIGIPLDTEGPDLERLESALRGRRPRLLYTTATFQNPTGLCMSARRRRDLLELAAAYDLLVIEDDIYREIALTGTPPPPLKSLPGGRERVIYVDGFSKSLLPGLRVGYAMPPAELYRPLLEAHRLRTLCGPILVQSALTEFLRRGGYARHLERALPVYRARRDALLASLATAMPEGTEWSEPAGGLCVWLSLPEGVSTTTVYRGALAAGVSAAPGDRFLTRPTTRGHLRLSFGALEQERIPAAIDKLADVVRAATRNATSASPLEAVPLV